jgi:hypothetical protein
MPPLPVMRARRRARRNPDGPIPATISGWVVTGGVPVRIAFQGGQRPRWDR